jgi:hypothetical protein
MKKIATLISMFCLAMRLFAQVDLPYYLPPNVQFNPSIPPPASIIGHQVGEWHITHDRLVNYMMALDKASDRITLEITGQTHEARPIILMTITSPKNHQNIESIRAQHVQLSDPLKYQRYASGIFYWP